MNTVIYQMQRVLIVVAMSAMVGYGEDSNSEDGNPSPKIEKTLVAIPAKPCKSTLNMPRRQSTPKRGTKSAR